MPTSDLDAPTQRILAIAELIAERGPITLVELCAALPFSRAAIWRAVDTLRLQGWVRMRAGDNAFEMRGELADRLARGHRSNPEVEAIAPIRERIMGYGPVHVELGGFTGTGVFRVLESTRKSYYSGQFSVPSLVDDDLAIAAQLTIPPPSLVLHLRAFMVSARDDERRVITSGEHGRVIAKLRDVGHIWQEDHSGIAMALPEFRGFALRAELWRVGKGDIARFRTQMEAFLAEQQGLFPATTPLSGNYAVNSNVPSSIRNAYP